MNCPRKFLAVSAGDWPGFGVPSWLCGAQEIVTARAPVSEAGRAQYRRIPARAIHTTVSLVVVPVTVKDSAGELVTDLAAKRLPGL